MFVIFISMEGHQCNIDVDSIGLQLTVRRPPGGEEENLGVDVQVQAIMALDKRNTCKPLQRGK